MRAARVCKSSGASASQKKKILEKAAELNTAQFTDWIETKSGVAGKGDTTTDSFTLIGTSAQIGELKAWLAEQDLIEWAGVDTPIGIVLAALQSATTEFKAAAAEESAEEIQVGAPDVEEGWGE